jgi:hypothetical protein
MNIKEEIAKVEVLEHIIKNYKDLNVKGYQMEDSKKTDLLKEI